MQLQGKSLSLLRQPVLTSCVSGVKGIRPEQLDTLVAEHDVLYLLLHSASDTKILVRLRILPSNQH
jgi:hypothetical protein